MRDSEKLITSMNCRVKVCRRSPIKGTEQNKTGGNPRTASGGKLMLQRGTVIGNNCIQIVGIGDMVEDKVIDNRLF